MLFLGPDTENISHRASSNMEHVSPFPPARSPEFAFTDTYFPPSNLVVDKCVRLSKEASLNPSPQPSSQISATLNLEVTCQSLFGYWIPSIC